MTDELSAKLQSERDEALATLSEIVDHARYKSLGDGRIRDESKSRIRLKYLRVIISAQAERRKLLQDKELEELRERLEAIEKEQQRGKPVYE